MSAGRCPATTPEPIVAPVGVYWWPVGFAAFGLLVLANGLAWLLG